ncbi:MAG: thymidine phosphorylase, partial [Candidatus Aureabacteria bacterium]|nr:thymidine phosphorylase [Candidatus Auribacterota bacterium]
SLVLAPIVAASGIPVPMMSGRGLGHSGGTLDKLESIPGFRTNLTEAEFVEAVRRVGVAIIGQTRALAPADKKIYMLRDVTATVDSIPLICGSIMSKKLAAGPDAFVFDIKTGNGAFMSTMELAETLARTMNAVAHNAGRDVVTLITDMNQPLGRSIGNALEIKETIEALRGAIAPDLKELVLSLASWMMVFGGAAKTAEEGYRLAEENLTNGKGLEIFLCGVALGAGRESVDSSIDMAVWFTVNKKIGDPVAKGASLITMHYNDAKKAAAVRDRLKKAYRIGPKAVRKPPMVYKVIRP